MAGTIACATALVGAQPTTLPSTRPAPVAAEPVAAAPAEVEAHDWVVLVCDADRPEANARTAFTSTLPPFVGTRRPASEEGKRDDPQPVGVIRLLGDPARAAGERIDVLLEMRGGTFVAHWPKARTKPNRLLWQNVELAGGAPASEGVDVGHWFSALRGAAGAPYLTVDGRGERFLLYDVELNYPAPLKVTAAADGALRYHVVNASAAPLRDVAFYKRADGVWQTGTFDELSATTRPATAPAAAAATADAPTDPPAARAPSEVQAVVAEIARRVAAAGPLPAPTSGAAATRPGAATQPAGEPLALRPSGTSTGAEVLAPWREKLAAAGLAATDHDLILRVLERHALDDKRLTAVARLDGAELDRLLPLDVTPTPRKTVRVALVVVRGIDPAITDEIDDLIAQLGDGDWNVRERAYQQLAAFGAAAQPKLTEAMRHKDVEIVYRAERLLQRLASPALNPQ